jgi:predicted 2-oxoglutarate/Fe(II)-dependent dioxygenase YbiX
MEPEMIGTLVVALPSAYEGGALVFDDGSGPRAVDLRATKGTVRWVAFFGDVDHVVERVTSGHRVTLT